MVTQESSKNDKNFELNLVPFIDVLSTCICFLLLTTIWIHLGTMNVAQAVGEENATGGDNQPSVSVMLEDDGDIQLVLKDVSGAPADLLNVSLPAGRGGIDWGSVDEYIQSLAANIPSVKMALIMPSSKSNYDDIIRMMDRFKKNQINEIGIAPL